MKKLIIILVLVVLVLVCDNFFNKAETVSTFESRLHSVCKAGYTWMVYDYNYGSDLEQVTGANGWPLTC